MYAVCSPSHADTHMLLFVLCSPEVLNSSGQVGVPRVDKRQTTEVQPFSFNTERRATERKSHEHPPPAQADGAAGAPGTSRRMGATLTRSQGLKRSILDGPVSGR